MITQVNGTTPPLAVAGKTSDTPSDTGMAWLYEEGPKELPSEDDDFEGNRNWAVILTLGALVAFPIVSITLIAM